MNNEIFTKSEKFKEEYSCRITRIGQVIPIEKSKYLAYTLVGGESIVVRKSEITEGSLFFYACRENVLPHEFLSKLNLYMFEHRNLNSNYEEVQKLVDEAEALAVTNKEAVEAKLAEAKRMCGYFGPKRRVRIAKLQGVASNGFLFSPDDLITWQPELKTFFDSINLADYEGTFFDTIDGELFCYPYVPKKATPRTPGSKRDKNSHRNKKLKRFERIIPGQFEFHYDTSRLGDNIWKIKPEDTIVASLKIHGCVDANTIINTDKGDYTIKEIVDRELPVKIKAFDIDKNEIVYVPINQYYMVPDDGEWYEIELENGKTLTITGNNPVWLPDSGFYCRADQLNINDVVLLDDLKTTKIVSMSKAEIRDRYDLTVNTTQNFFANGILIHNTSFIAGNVKTNIPLPLPFYKKWWNKLVDSTSFTKRFRITDSYVDYGNVYSSRTVIKNEYINPVVAENKGFYKVDIWGEYNELLKDFIPNGWTLYGEIFGYLTGSQSMIQKQYDYGCAEGTNKLMIYRISQEMPDGTKREWEVAEVKEWTEKLMKEHPEIADRLHPIDILYHGTLAELYPEVDTANHWHENILMALKNDKQRFKMECDEPLCKNKVPREGLVIRIDNDPCREAFKLKTDKFFMREAKQMDAGDVSDIEMQEADYQDDGSDEPDIAGGDAE